MPINLASHKKKRRTRNKHGRFDTRSTLKFDQNHQHCNKKCLNCKNIFIDIKSFNAHLTICNIQSFQQLHSLPQPNPKKMTIVADACKGNVHELTNFDNQLKAF